MAECSKRKLGYLFPGLGHLVSGHVITGLGLLSYVACLIWAAVVGFPRMGELLFPPSEDGGFRLHPWIALVGWVAIAVGAWWTAHRFAIPSDQSGDRYSAWAEIKKQFKRNRAGLFGLHGVNVLLFIAILTPFLAPFDPNKLDVGGQLLSPQWGYLMGTDEFGRDIFSRVLFGARISLSIGFVAVAISVTVGSMVGAVAGYYGGWIDRLSMWGVDLLLSLPRLVLLLAVIGLFRAAGAQSIFVIVVILGLTGWMSVSRIVRSSVFSLKEQDFIQAGRALGFSNRRIIFIHLLPNAMAPIIVYASLAIGGTILIEAALSFLGLGVPPPTPTWGAIITDGKEHMRSAPWITVFPGLMIVAAVMSFNLLGDGLRDAMDPKLRGQDG